MYAVWPKDGRLQLGAERDKASGSHRKTQPAAEKQKGSPAREKQVEKDG